MFDFENDNCPFWAVIKNDGTFAGAPCKTEEEAEELQAQHEGSEVFLMKWVRWYF